MNIICFLIFKINLVYYYYVITSSYCFPFLLQLLNPSTQEIKPTINTRLVKESKENFKITKLQFIGSI